MITFKRAYVATIDGKERVFPSLEAAQQAEVAALLAKDNEQPCDYEEIAATIIQNKDKLLAILTLNDQSRPRARGQRKPRKANPAPELALKEGAAA